MMTDTNMPLTADGDFDDLPRTLRRERERQEAATSSKAQTFDAPPPYEVDHEGYHADHAPQPVPASVERFNVSFFQLMGFLLKAVVAAIPALILLTVILWFAGQALQAFFPELVQLKILISFPADTAN